MMSDESGTVRQVAWGEILPWLMIPRALRLATSLPVLFVAMLGILLMPVGWWGAELLLPSQQQQVARDVVFPLGTPTSPGSMRAATPRPQLEDLYRPMLSAAELLVRPLHQILRGNVSWTELAYWTIGGTWNLLVWGLFGGIITRMAVMQYGREEREGLVASARFVSRRFLAYAGGPLFALIGVLVILGLSLAIGLLMQSSVGVLLASIVWFFVLLGGVLTTVLVVALLLGWPLMWGALSAEEMGDVFEGAHRTYAYFYGRPAHYAFYALLAVVVGSAAYYVVNAFAQLTLYFSMWAVTWALDAPSVEATGSGAGLVGMTIISALNTLVTLVPAAFRFSFLFTAAGVIYLLVRRDSDQIEFDTVHVPGQQTRFGLPPITTDEAGVPQVDETESDSSA